MQRQRRKNMKKGDHNSILLQFAGGKSRAQIAEDMGVGYATVCHVINKKHGRRVKPVKAPPATVTTTPAERRPYTTAPRSMSVSSTDKGYREKYFTLLEKYVALVETKL